MKIKLLGGPYHGKIGDSSELMPPVIGNTPPNSLVMNPAKAVYILHNMTDDGYIEYRYEEKPYVTKVRV